METFEAKITIKTYPVREAKSKTEFINALILEYNTKCADLFEITKEDIQIFDYQNGGE
jgi:hypothetical protein